MRCRKLMSRSSACPRSIRLGCVSRDESDPPRTGYTVSHNYQVAASDIEDHHNNIWRAYSCSRQIAMLRVLLRVGQIVGSMAPSGSIYWRLPKHQRYRIVHRFEVHNTLSSWLPVRQSSSDGPTRKRRWTRLPDEKGDAVTGRPPEPAESSDVVARVRRPDREPYVESEAPPSRPASLRSSFCQPPSEHATKAKPSRPRHEREGGERVLDRARS